MFVSWSVCECESRQDKLLPEMHNICVSSTLSVGILNENELHLQCNEMKMKSVVGVFDNVTIPIQLKRYLYHPHPYHYQDDGNAGDSTTNRMPIMSNIHLNPHEPRSSSSLSL